MLRQRAIQAEDKLERRQAILDAVARLLVDRGERVPSVAEVAEAASLAKGTVYLYFASKEELLLALHERAVSEFFAELADLLAGERAVEFEDIYAVTRRHMVAPSHYLPLAARCFAMLHREIPGEVAEAFRLRLGERLLAVGGLLERRYLLAAGEGPTLLRHSYALIIGLWHMAAAHQTSEGSVASGPLALFSWDYDRELERALRALWTGRIGAARSN